MDVIAYYNRKGKPPGRGGLGKLWLLQPGYGEQCAELLRMGGYEEGTVAD